MVDSTHSDDRPPSPDLSTLILEDYSQKLGCSPPMSCVINFDQKWALSVEESPGSDEHGSYKRDDLTLVARKGKTCISSTDEAGVSGVLGIGNDGLGSFSFGGSEVERGNGVGKVISLAKDVTGQVGADSISDCGQVLQLACSGAVALDGETNNVMIKNESLHLGMLDNMDEDNRGADSEILRANLNSNRGQETQVLYTCVGALIEEETDCIAAKEEPLDTSGSTYADEDSEAESGSDTSTSESDTSSSSDDDDEEEEEEKGDDENVEKKDNEVVEGEDKINDLDKKPKSYTKNEHKEHQDSDGFHLEEANYSSDEEMEKEVKRPIKSQNELDALPPVPPIDAVLLPHHQTLPVGVISSIVGARVIIDGNVKRDPLNEGSILWITETRAPLGLVDEIFGPVKNPYYIVRYNSEEDIPPEVHVGTSVSSVAEFSTNILNQNALYKKGYDASGENDEELEEEIEFSDDEKEAEYRRSLRQHKRVMDGQSHGNPDRKNNQNRRAGFQRQMPQEAIGRTGVQKQMQQEAIRKDKKTIPGPSSSVQQRSPPVTGDANAVTGAQPHKNFLGAGSITVPPVHSDSSLVAQPDLRSPLNSPWIPAPPASLQNVVVSGNLMMNGALTQPGNSVMQGGVAPFIPPQQPTTGFLSGAMMNTLACQSMLHMQNMGPSGGLLMNPTPFQLQPQQLGSAPAIYFQNQHQALQQQQQQQQQQLSMSQFSYGFPMQSQFTPNQPPNIFSLNGQMNPSLGSMCFEPLMQNTSVQAPFRYDNTFLAATNINGKGQCDMNPLPNSSNGNIRPPTQFHMGTSSLRGRGVPFPRGKHPFGKRRP